MQRLAHKTPFFYGLAIPSEAVILLLLLAKPPQANTIAAEVCIPSEVSGLLEARPAFLVD